jgi:hypothetical protein
LSAVANFHDAGAHQKFAGFSAENTPLSANGSV